MSPARAALAPALLSAALGAGCGGGAAVDPGPAVLSAQQVRTGHPDGTLLQSRPTYNAVSDRFTFPLDDDPNAPGFVAMGRVTDPKLAGTPYLSAYSAFSDAYNGVRGALPSGDGTAHALRGGASGMPARLERGHERLGETVLPASGRATFIGGYMGVLAEATTLEHRGYVKGIVTLVADFDGMFVAGNIGGRINDSDRNFDELILVESPIDTAGGSFGGPTSGGRQIDLPGFDGASGRYSGLIVGPDGGAAVGSVEITHQRFGADAIREWGAFVAD